MPKPNSTAPVRFTGTIDKPIAARTKQIVPITPGAVTPGWVSST